LIFCLQLVPASKHVLRSFCSFSFQMTKKHNDDCKRLLGLMGVPVVEVSLILSSIRCFKYFYTLFSQMS
jgi:hypothetical protein